MRILRIINDFADVNNKAEGLSTGPYELSLAQAKYVDKIYVLTGNLNKVNLFKGIFKYDLAEGKVTVYNLPRALWKFGPFLTASLCVPPMYLYFRLTGKIDLVHNHQQMGVWFLLYKWLFGFLDKMPVVHTNHGVIKARRKTLEKQDQKLPFMTKYFEYPIHSLSDWLSMQVSNAVIAVSSNVKEELEREYKVKKPIYVVENGANTFKFTKSGERVDFGFGTGKVVLVHWGRLSKRKNVDLLVEALRYLPENYVLAIWGPWDESFKPEVYKSIKQNKLEGRIKDFNQPIPYWDIDKYARSGDIFVLPSEHEGLPKVIPEALASGLKVVASGFEMSQQIPNLYFLDSIEPKAIAEKIIKAHNSPDKYKETMDIIEKHYSWDVSAKKIGEIYEKVMLK